MTLKQYRVPIDLIHDVSYLYTRTENDGIITWSHSLLGDKHFQWRPKEMSIQLFSKWKVDHLKTFLKKRGVVLSGRKVELAEKAYYTWRLKLEVA